VFRDVIPIPGDPAEFHRRPRFVSTGPSERQAPIFLSGKSLIRRVRNYPAAKPGLTGTGSGGFAATAW
jgi:hypothetical protein